MTVIRLYVRRTDSYKVVQTEGLTVIRLYRQRD